MTRPVFPRLPRTASSVALSLVSILAVAAAVGAQQASRLRINGTPASDAPITVKGKTYVSVDSLRSAGISVRSANGIMDLTLPGGAQQAADGGAGQQNGVEGKTGDWLFNGIWRFRVLSVSPADAATVGAGWQAKVEIRNGTKFSGYSPGGTGWQGITIVTEDGTSVAAASDAPELRDKGLAQGASNAVTLFFPTDSASKPTRIILRLDPKGLEGVPAGLRYTTKDPSFRVSVAN